MRKLGPQWKKLLDESGDDPAVRVCFAPVSPRADKRAREAASKVIQDDPENAAGAGEAISSELIRCGIVAWEGVGAPGSSEDIVAPVTAENIEHFLADAELFAAADREYVVPWVMRELEKNGFAASSNGTSTAETAASDTANSPAVPKNAAGAKIALTAKTNRKPTKAKGYGRSS